MNTETRKRQEGIALITVVVLMALILFLGIFGAQGARIEMLISRNELLAKQALAIADAGLQHAYALLQGSPGFDQELDGGGATGGTGGVLANLGTAVDLDGVSYRFVEFGGGPSDGYFVRVVDNWDETSGANDDSADVDSSLRIVSRGYIGRAERRVEGVVATDTGPECAIITRGDIEISGNPEITGDKGCVHTNSNLVNIGGDSSTTIEAGATASGTMGISGTPRIEGEVLNTSGKKNAYKSTHSGEPQMTIPAVCPLRFGSDGLNLAEDVRALGGHLLSENGKIYDSSQDWECSPLNLAGNPCTISLSTCGPTSGTACVHSGGNAWRGWKYNSDSSAKPGAKWVYEGSTAHDGVFFVEGWVNVSSNPGEGQTGAGRWDVTIVAMNTIDVSGNPVAVPFVTSGNLRNVLFVSGNDLGLGGNLGASDKPAASFAHQQLKLNGDPEYWGFFVAEDGGTICPNDPAPTASSKESKEDGRSIISGNPAIHFDSGSVDTALFPGRLTLVSWNEARAD